VRKEGTQAYECERQKYLWIAFVIVSAELSINEQEMHGRRRHSWRGAYRFWWIAEKRTIAWLHVRPWLHSVLHQWSPLLINSKAI